MEYFAWALVPIVQVRMVKALREVLIQCNAMPEEKMHLDFEEIEDPVKMLKSLRKESRQSSGSVSNTDQKESKDVPESKDAPESKNEQGDLPPLENKINS